MRQIKQGDTGTQDKGHAALTAARGRIYTKQDKPDLQSRSTLRAWINYMVANPAYFWQATGLRHTNANIGRIARELFGDDVRLGKVRVKHYHRKKILQGLSVIAQHIGTTPMVIVAWYYKQHKHGKRWEQWKIPVWKEGNEYYAYMGRLVRWAKQKKVGKYNAKVTAKA